MLSFGMVELSYAPTRGCSTATVFSVLNTCFWGRRHCVVTVLVMTLYIVINTSKSSECEDSFTPTFSW